MEILLCVLIGLGAFNVALTLAIYLRVARRERAERREAEAQEAMDRAAEAETRRSRAMDEGFDNLMTYEVHSGRGKTTGGAL